MKVIKLGKKDPVKYEATCISCGAVIEATKDELNIKYCTKEQYSFAHERCLECESPVVFYKK
jgi:hypothetical protein